MMMNHAARNTQRTPTTLSTLVASVSFAIKKCLFFPHLLNSKVTLASVHFVEQVFQKLSRIFYFISAMVVITACDDAKIER